jgi:hypothetical protein
VDTGSREENASKQESRASVLIQSGTEALALFPAFSSRENGDHAHTATSPRAQLRYAGTDIDCE